MGDPAAVQVTGVRQHEAWQANDFPPVERVRDGLWSVPVPIPDNPLRYVLVYVLELPDGIAIVDAGWDTPEAWDGLRSGLQEVGYDVGDVRAVLVTHAHPDHYGLAGAVREASGAWIGMHPADAAVLPVWYGDIPRGLRTARAMLVACGVPDNHLDTLSGSSLEIAGTVHYALPDRLIDDGDRVDLAGWDLRAIWTPGHTPGHLCFVSEQRRLLLTGDHVLPRITPNITTHGHARQNSLGQFLDSLAKLRGHEPEEVLPAHEFRFAGLEARLEQLLAHHEDRLEEVRLLLVDNPGSTAWEVARELTWSRSWQDIPEHMRRAAVLETLAHLVLLETREVVWGDDAVSARWWVRPQARERVS